MLCTFDTHFDYFQRAKSIVVTEFVSESDGILKYSTTQISFLAFSKEDI